MFGNERLDSLDRRILELVCKYGREGQSFNKLVEKAKPFVSRSTFAFRTKRLERLNYLEKMQDTRRRQVIRIKGKSSILMLMRIVSRMKVECNEVERSLQFATREKNHGEVKQMISKSSERLKNIYSLLGTYAVLFGEAVAGDLLLSMTMEDYKKLYSDLLSFTRARPEVMRDIAEQKLTLVTLESLREDFQFAFGTEMDKTLPNFSNYLGMHDR